MKITHQTLERLREVDKEIAFRFPSEYDLGLGGVGLLLRSKLTNGRYYCTPTNSRSFAGTGGEGVHFSFLGRPDEISEASPVIATIPMAFANPNFILGENLFDFLCFGMYRGFFALEQLGYNFEEAFTAYTDPSWQSTEDDHFAVGYGVDDRKRAILDLLIERFRLDPWQEPRAKFDRLQSTYLSTLQIPPDNITAIHIRRRARVLAWSTADLCQHLSQGLGAACTVKERSDGSCITVEGGHTDILVTVDETGSPTNAELQVGYAAEPELAEQLWQVFEDLGWELYEPGEDD
jgi:hypothetical protein